MGRVRLCDIASDAGVSVSAVSRILSCDNSRKHSDETKRKVIASAEKLGWFDSVSDKAIKAKKPLRIRRIYSSSVNAYQKSLFDKGFDKAFSIVSSHIPIELVDNGEFVIVFGDEFTITPAIHAGFRYIDGCFNIVADLGKAFSSVASSGTKAFIGNSVYDFDFELAEYASSLDPVSGYDAAVRLLEECKPSLICASDDNIATGVLKRVSDMDIPVIGFGNFPIAEEIGLSSFAVDYFSMGYLAALMAEHYRFLHSDIEVPVSFIERKPLHL